MLLATCGNSNYNFKFENFMDLLTVWEIRKCQISSSSSVDDLKWVYSAFILNQFEFARKSFIRRAQERDDDRDTNKNWNKATLLKCHFLLHQKFIESTFRLCLILEEADNHFSFIKNVINLRNNAENTNPTSSAKRSPIHIELLLMKWCSKSFVIGIYSKISIFISSSYKDRTYFSKKHEMIEANRTGIQM